MQLAPCAAAAWLAAHATALAQGASNEWTALLEQELELAAAFLFGLSNLLSEAAPVLTHAAQLSMVCHVCQ